MPRTRKTARKPPRTPRRLDAQRRCPHCRSYPHPAGPDACLGVLPGVEWACCGHGATDNTAYVTFTRERLQHDAALRQYLRAVARGAPRADRAGSVRLPGIAHPVPEGCYGRAALAYFRSQGVGPEHPPAQLWLPLWRDDDPGLLSPHGLGPDVIA